MKKTLWAGLATGLLLLGASGVALADTMFYTETYSPGTNYKMSTSYHTTVNWTFNLTDNPGWSTPGQTFNNGDIVISVQDDGGTGDGNEKATFRFDGGSGPTNVEINNSAWSGIFTVDASQIADGLIFASLTATLGDFYFRDSQFNVTSSYTPPPPPPNPNPAPEPATLFLMGSGLVGLASSLRRKKG